MGDARANRASWPPIAACAPLLGGSRLVSGRLGDRAVLSEQLIRLLVCPESRMPVSLADERLLQAANRAVADERLKNRAGKTVTQSLAGGLVRQDRAVLYPIVDGIPILLAEEGILLDPLKVEAAP